VPLQTVNDIFFTHLHVDHYADLPYLYAFAPWMGRWKPLRVHGPSGRTPKDGIKHMIEGMEMMTHWHTDSFNCCPMGDGYEVEVNEFDFRDDNGICYDKDGVTICHWRRSHVKDGASAYRLDWERPVVRLDGRRAAGRTLAGAGKGRGRVRDRGATGHGEPPGVEIRHAAHHRHDDDRPGP
jgi:ribonuclease BN (tRNA processing enzyme)